MYTMQKIALRRMSKNCIRHEPRSFIGVYFTVSEQKVAKYCKENLQCNFGKFKTIFKLSTMQSAKKKKR
jgi:hypothetical protein